MSLPAPRCLSLQGFVPHLPRQLLDVVDAIWDWDVADAEAARALMIHHAPSTSLLLMASYRAPVDLDQRGAALPGKCATLIGDATLTLRPTGPLGMIVVLLKPDAATRVVGARLGEFANAHISLAELFGEHEAAACSELLVRSQVSAERVGTVATFLLSHLRPVTDTLALRAAAHLRRDPALRMQQLADRLDITPRHLSRVFQSVLGMSPKRFARLARLEHIIRLRQRGLAWADIACDCGLADQAHLIREFEALVGVRPTEFFARAGFWVPDTPVCGPFIIRPMTGEV